MTFLCLRPVGATPSATRRGASGCPACAARAAERGAGQQLVERRSSSRPWSDSRPVQPEASASESKPKVKTAGQQADEQWDEF